MSLAKVGVIATTVFAYRWADGLNFLFNAWFYAVVALFLVPAIWKILTRFWKAWQLRSSLRVLPHSKNELLDILLQFKNTDFRGMPFPVSNSTDNRYEMLHKFLGVTETLGFGGLIVLIDRVDEPYLVNGSPELEKLLVWPILDNKLLKHERVGLKMLLPGELLHFMEKENADFHQRARMDKQNLIKSLDWTGESLFDLANERLKACAADEQKNGKAPQMTDFFDPALNRQKLIAAFADLRVPRHLFKFLYGLFSRHVNDHSDTEPVWLISEATFQSALHVYLRDRAAAERNLGVV